MSASFCMKTGRRRKLVWPMTSSPFPLVLFDVKTELPDVFISHSCSSCGWSAFAQCCLLLVTFHLSDQQRWWIIFCDCPRRLSRSSCFMFVCGTVLIWMHCSQNALQPLLVEPGRRGETIKNHYSTHRPTKPFQNKTFPFFFSSARLVSLPERFSLSGCGFLFVPLKQEVFPLFIQKHFLKYPAGG